MGYNETTLSKEVLFYGRFIRHLLHRGRHVPDP